MNWVKLRRLSNLRRCNILCGLLNWQSSFSRIEVFYTQVFEKGSHTRQKQCKHKERWNHDIPFGNEALGIRYSGLNASNSSDGNEMCKKRSCVSSTESWHESKRIRKQSETCFGEMFACQVFGKGAFARRNLTRKHRLLSRQTSFHSSNVEARWRVKAVIQVFLCSRLAILFIILAWRD